MVLSSSALVLSHLLIIAYRRSGELSNPVLGGQISLFELPKEGESVAHAMLEKYGIPSREQPKTKGRSIP